MAELHDPADAEKRQHEAAEAVGAVVNALILRFLRRDSHHDGSEQREQKRGFEMRQINLWH